MKKQPALLLEVLIALVLIALSAGALMRQPLLLYRAEIEQLERIECDRIAAWTYTEIREKFLKNQIPWSQIPGLKARGPAHHLPEARFDALPLAGQPITRTYTLETLKEKHASDGKILRLVSIHIELGSGRKKRQFSYQVNVMHCSLSVCPYP